MLKLRQEFSPQAVKLARLFESASVQLVQVTAKDGTRSSISCSGLDMLLVVVVI